MMGVLPPINLSASGRSLACLRELPRLAILHQFAEPAHGRGIFSSTELAAISLRR